MCRLSKHFATTRSFRIGCLMRFTLGTLTVSDLRSGGLSCLFQIATIVYAPALCPTTQRAQVSVAMHVAIKVPAEPSVTADIRSARKVTRHSVRFADSFYKLEPQIGRTVVRI
jgi:hypothetical protein